MRWYSQLGIWVQVGRLEHMVRHNNLTFFRLVLNWLLGCGFG